MLKLTYVPKENIQMVVAAAKTVYTSNSVMQQLAAAQAIHESALFRTRPSSLALEGNNLFGIKGNGTDGVIVKKTWEVIKGRKVIVFDKFAKNKTLEDSFEQHKKLMENGTKSKPKRYKPVLNAKTVEEAAKALVTGGYATDPIYAKKLIQIWKDYVKDKFK